MDICARVARLPEVSQACRRYAEEIAAVARVKAAPHGSIVRKIGVRPGGYPDWIVHYDAYEPHGRGTASSIEMGHINMQAGRRWTEGIHVLRDAMRECAE